jgi:hypothetical protein
MLSLSRVIRLGLGSVLAGALLAPGPAAPQPPPPGSRAPIPGGPLRVVNLPDLRVEVANQSYEHCTGKSFKLRLLAKIRNHGPGDAVLPAEWTKPWVTAYPSVKMPNFVQPYQTGGKQTVLKPGQETIVEFDAMLTDPPGGVPWQMIVMVDPKNVIKEVNENNNTAKLGIQTCPK